MVDSCATTHHCNTRDSDAPLWHSTAAHTTTPTTHDREKHYDVRTPTHPLSSLPHLHPDDLHPHTRVADVLNDPPPRPDDTPAELRLAVDLKRKDETTRLALRGLRLLHRLHRSLPPRRLGFQRALLPVVSAAAPSSLMRWGAGRHTRGGEGERGGEGGGGG